MMSGKPKRLVFEEAPKVVIVAEKGLRSCRLFIDGQEVKGIQSLQFEASVDEIPALSLTVLCPVVALESSEPS